jgi:hypothetical protein
MALLSGLMQIKYKTEIRQVYMDLLSSGVSIEKCATVVRSVLYCYSSRKNKFQLRKKRLLIS